MRRAHAIIALVVCVMAGLALAPAATGATFADAGWWDRNNGAPLVGGAAPPADGVLRVQHDAQGEAAVAALRFQLSETETSPRLTLRVEGTALAAPAGFRACPAANAWAGATPGPWAERPEQNCAAGSTGGVIAADGLSVTFDMSSLLQGRTLDVVIAPAPTGEDPVQLFTADFATPTDADLSTQAVTTTTAFVPPTTAAPPSSGSSGSTSAGSSSGSTSSSGSSGSGVVAAPATTAAPPTTAAPASTETSDSPVTVVSAAGSFDPNTATDVDGAEQAAAVGGESTVRTRLLALLIAAAILAGGVYLYMTERNRLLMTRQGVTVGGLGAFSKERTDPAPEVS